MITKERLEELIEQGAKVWCVREYIYYDESKPNKKIEYYDLSNEDICISPLEFRGYGLRVFDGLGYWNDIRFEHLFETKAEAEWHAEFGCIERAERLVLPTWEEVNLLTKYTKYQFYGKDNALYGLCLSPKDSLTRFDGSIEELKGWCGIDVDANCEIEHFEPLTKENYTLACRKCKELFLGEKE